LTGDQVVSRRAGGGDRFVKLVDPAAIFLVRHVLDALADAGHLILVADPFVAVADEAPDRVGVMPLDADDHHPRQVPVSQRDRHDAGIKISKRHPPFLHHRAQRVAFISKQGRVIARLDQETLVRRRREHRCAQLGQTVDRMFEGRGDFRVPGEIEILYAEQGCRRGKQLFLHREQRRQFDIARMQFDLDDGLMQHLELDEAQVLHREPDRIVVGVGIADRLEEFGAVGQQPIGVRRHQQCQAFHGGTSVTAGHNAMGAPCVGKA